MSGLKRRRGSSSTDDDEAIAEDVFDVSLSEINYSPPPRFSSSEGSPVLQDCSDGSSLSEPVECKSSNNDETCIDLLDATALGDLSASSEESLTIDDHSKSSIKDLDEDRNGEDELLEDFFDSFSHYGSSCGSGDSVSELSLSDSDDESLIIPGDPPVYEGAPLKLSESMAAVLSFVIRHELSGKAIEDLLHLINLHCKEEQNHMLTSLYFLKKYFTLLQAPVICHYYCSSCYKKLDVKCAPCPNALLHPDSSGSDVFVEVPLVPQLQDLFSQTEFFSNLSYRDKRAKSNLQNLEDIYDGQLYKELFESNFFSRDNVLNFSMIANTDGVPIFHSTNKSLWPIYLNVLELPPNLRFKQEFTIIGGFWFGGKPNANLMLSPLIPSFLKIRNGFKVQPSGKQDESIAKDMLLAATADLPAKSMLLGMTLYSGNYGCQICKIQGGSVKIEVKKKSGAKKEKRGFS